jgi:aspartate ammonia-lyase
MYELKKNEKVFTSKFVGTGPSSFEKRIYRAAVSQRLRNTAIDFARCSSDCRLLRLKSEDGMESVFIPAMCQGLSVPSRSYRCLKPNSLHWTCSSLFFNFIWKLTVA